MFVCMCIECMCASTFTFSVVFPLFFHCFSIVFTLFFHCFYSLSPPLTIHLTINLPQATSSLTMKVLGTVRNIFTIVVGVIFYAETVAFNEGMGYTVALAGFVAYNMAKTGYWDHSSSSSSSSPSSSSPADLKGLGLKGLTAASSDDIEARSPLLGGAPLPVIVELPPYSVSASKKAQS